MANPNLHIALIKTYSDDLRRVTADRVLAQSAGQRAHDHTRAVRRSYRDLITRRVGSTTDLFVSDSQSTL
jgi:hypothetical protein